MSTSRRQQAKGWALYMGDFSLLRNFLSTKKDRSPWVMLKLLDTLLRGWSQIILINNPISGLLIVSSFAILEPGLTLLATTTGILGLLFSLLIGVPRYEIENGLIMLNPLLYGAATYSMTPHLYDSFIGHLLFYLLTSVAFSVYFSRALGSRKLPYLSAPYNIVHLIFIFIVASTDSIDAPPKNVTTIGINMSSVIPDLFVGVTGPIISNATNSNLDWGMVFRGMVTSASQVFTVDNVALSSIIYLAILTYSPIMAAFSFSGAMLGSLTGLFLAVPVEEAYSGIWGYNSLLTTSALGGLFVIAGVQATMAAAFAGIFATILQYVMIPILAKIGLPVLSLPFVLTTWLFLGLRDSEESEFRSPENISYPEKQRYDFIEAQRATTTDYHSGASSEGDNTPEERRSLK